MVSQSDLDRIKGFLLDSVGKHDIVIGISGGIDSAARRQSYYRVDIAKRIGIAFKIQVC